MDLVIHSDDEDDTDDEYYERYPRPSHQVSGEPSNAYLGYPTLHLFKELEIVIEEASIYSGAALRMLSCPPYDGCPFPQVRRLILNLTTNDVRGDRKTSSQGDQINISAFVQRVMEMAPMVSGIQVTSICNYIPPEINSPNFIDLISQLFRLVTRVEFTIVDISNMPVTLYLNEICDLAHIKYTTLEKSDGIFHNADGGCITYPRLYTLKLADIAGIHDPAQLVSRGVVPFPRLRHIQLRSYNPFGDDVLFRGNAASLESLDMQLSIIDADMLYTYRAFTPTSHPKLKYVKVSVWSSTYYTTAEDLQLGLSIGIGAPVREYSEAFHSVALATMFTPFSHYACTQVLSLPNLCPNLWQVIALIKSLPLLSDIRTSLVSLGAMPDGVTLDTLPGHIVSNYAPMGRRFRCWHLCSGRNCTELLTCVLLLAPACPNFDYADVVTRNTQSQFIMEQMEKVITSDRFRHYAPCLRRLLFHGWNSKRVA